MRASLQASVASSSSHAGAPACRRSAAAQPAAAVCSSRQPVIAARQQQQQQQQRTSVVAAASAADIREIEELAVLAPSPALGGAAAAPQQPAGAVKLRVRMRGYDIGILAKAVEQVKVIAALTGARVKGPVNLPTKKRVYCVLRSPHVNKDAREHFEVRVHNRLVDVCNLSAQTVQALMEWVPPSGLEVETSIV